MEVEERYAAMPHKIMRMRTLLSSPLSSWLDDGATTLLCRQQPIFPDAARQQRNISIRAARQQAVSVGAIVLDSEKFAFNASSSAAYLAALSRKNDLIYNLSHEAFPKARILQYGRGGAARWPYGIDKATAVADMVAEGLS